MDALKLKKSSASILNFNYLDINEIESAKQFASEKDKLFSNLRSKFEEAMSLLKG